MRALVVAATALVCATATYAAERVPITAPDGIQLAGELAGTRGPAVIVAHDVGDGRDGLAPLVDALVGAGFRALTVDLRGHGASEGARDPAAVERDLEGAYRYVVGRKITPVAIVGVGAAGDAAFLLAARVRVRAVVAVSPTATAAVANAATRTAAAGLVIAAADDDGGTAAAERLARAPSGAITAHAVSGNARGAALLAAGADALLGAIRDFLTARLR